MASFPGFSVTECQQTLLVPCFHNLLLQVRDSKHPKKPMNDLGADGTLFPVLFCVGSQNSHTPSPPPSLLLPLSSSPSLLHPTPSSPQTSSLSLCGCWCSVVSTVQRSRPSTCGGLLTPASSMVRLATTSLPSPVRVSRHTVQCLIPESHGLGMGHYVYQCVSIDTGSFHQHLFICSECSQRVDSASYTPHASSSGEVSLPEYMPVQWGGCPVGGRVVVIEFWHDFIDYNYMSLNFQLIPITITKAAYE